MSRGLSRAKAKSLRFGQIEKLLWAYPEGLSQAEVARRIGVNRSTISRYVAENELPSGVYVDDFSDIHVKFILEGTTGFPSR